MAGDLGELEPALALWPYLLAAAAGVLIAIGLAASLAPTLKCVRMRPVEALRGGRVVCYRLVGWLLHVRQPVPHRQRHVPLEA